jgi:hypothetical protein
MILHSAMIGLAVPGRPIRSLVAGDRSAGGVRDQTGPEPQPGLRWAAPHMGHTDNHGHQRTMKPKVGQAAHR